MDAQSVNASAQVASQVGLLTWIIVAITTFCGFLVIYVLHQSGREKERYAKLIEVHIENLGTKLDGHTATVNKTLGSVEEANRMQKSEHQGMTDALQKISATMVALTYICKGSPDAKPQHT